MKNSDLINLLDAINSLTGVKGKGFAYAIFKNKALIEEEIKIFEQVKREPHPDYPNYENERNIVCINYAKKDENGNPLKQGVPPQQHYVIDPAEMNNFQEEMQEVHEKYAEVLQDMEEAKKDQDEFLAKEAQIDLIKIKFEDLPDDIDANFIDKIKDMVEF
jgi:hypothetical protein